MKLLCSLVPILAALASPCVSQTINFETLPGGITPTDNMLITNQYQALGIIFSVAGGGGARMARVGPDAPGTPTAFWGPWPTAPGYRADQPAVGTNVGEWFLTDDGTASTALQVIVDYVAPVSYASGEMLDIDNGATPPVPEEWTVSAYNSLGQLIGTRILHALDPEAGNGSAYPWQFTFGSAVISKITFTDTSAPGASTGFALDNFNVGGASTSFESFCFGDTSGTLCPCGNVSPAGSGRGCANSLGSSGGLLPSGSSSLANDSMRLTATGMPNSAALYFQGDSRVNSGAGAAFGDGLRCAGGSTVRLSTKLNASGSSSYPVLGDAPISVRGGVTAQGTRTYQVWYRNADAAFCTAATFNLTNGVAATWGP